MTDTPQDRSASDPFARAWGDFLSQFGIAGAAASTDEASSPSWSDEAMKQMQRAFMDALAKYCDEYLRSPNFLNMMKQSMDNALSFKQHVDRFLAEAHRSVHSPSVGDIDDIVGLLRTIEDRVVERVDKLEGRLRHLESPKRKKPTQVKARPTAGRKSVKKKASARRKSSARKPAAGKTRTKSGKRK